MKGAQIVLVDDDVSLCRAMGRMLRQMGCSVESFTSASEALGSGAISQADCLLLDLAMPEMSGLEMQERIRGELIEVPIVFLSGQGDIPSTVQAMRGGAQDFLEKPVEAEALRDAVSAAVSISTQTSIDREQMQQTREQFESLTERQREVFLGVVAGHPNKVIAHGMGITIRTVKAHRREVMEKLGAHSVADLAFLARDLGL